MGQLSSPAVFGNPYFENKVVQTQNEEEEKKIKSPVFSSCRRKSGMHENSSVIDSSHLKRPKDREVSAGKSIAIGIRGDGRQKVPISVSVNSVGSYPNSFSRPYSYESVEDVEVRSLNEKLLPIILRVEKRLINLERISIPPSAISDYDEFPEESPQVTPNEKERLFGVPENCCSKLEKLSEYSLKQENVLFLNGIVEKLADSRFSVDDLKYVSDLFVPIVSE